MLTWLWLVSFPTFPENDFCFTISDDLFPQIHVDLKKKKSKIRVLTKTQNELKRTTTSKKRPEMDYNDQETI